MRLSVILGTEEERNAAIPAPQGYADGQACYDYYAGQLAAADSGTVAFQALPKQDPPSKSFFEIGVVESAIVDYLRDHDQPEPVKIICTDKEVARRYKVGYNFNIAGTKDDRMMEDDWD